jgi:transposase InsO family protein
MLTDDQEALLEDLYYKDGFKVGRDKLYDELVTKHEKLFEKSPEKFPSRRDVMVWLKDQEIHQRFRGAKKSSGISSFRPIKPLHSLSADLIDFTNKPAKNYRYILVVVDNFSRYMWALPITSKKPEATAPAMKRVLDDIMKEFKKKPAYIQTDDGSEFKADFTKLLESRGIKNQRTLAAQPWSNALVERANGKLKSVMFKNKADVGGSLLDRLPKGIQVYNDYENRTTRYAPKEAIRLGPTEQKLLIENVGKVAIKNKTTKPLEFKIGQRVRLKISKGALDKGLSAPNWSKDIYVILSVTRGKGIRPTKYKVGVVKSVDKKRYTYNDVLAISKVEGAPKEEGPKPKKQTEAEDAPRRGTRERKQVTRSSASSSTKSDKSSKPKTTKKKGEYVVQTIQAHRTNTSGKMEVRVKWKGYPKTNWEPVSAVKHTNAWKSYAKRKKLAPNPVAVKVEKGVADTDVPVGRVN